VLILLTSTYIDEIIKMLLYTVVSPLRKSKNKKVMPTVLERQSDTVVSVDRTIPAKIPEFVKSFSYPTLQDVGPDQYDLFQVQMWPDKKEVNVLHGNERTVLPLNRHTPCNVLHCHLFESGLIDRCLNLQDGEMIRRKPRKVYVDAFGRKGVFLFKSMCRHTNGKFYVPYVCTLGHNLVIRYFLITDKCIPEIYVGVFE
jgi:hypothetical protein